eukprot:4026469-Pleurochrysis_carterae.AAC.1
MSAFDRADVPLVLRKYRSSLLFPPELDGRNANVPSRLLYLHSAAGPFSVALNKQLVPILAVRQSCMSTVAAPLLSSQARHRPIMRSP